MNKKKTVLIILSIIILIPIVLTGAGFLNLNIKSKKINDDYHELLKNNKYNEAVSVEGVEVITQDVSCGYAVIEMFSAWCGNDITEETLYNEYGKVVTSTGDSFCKEMNKQFPQYETFMYKYLTNSEMIDLIYESLSDGMPVPIEWAAKMGDEWTLHYSLVVGMDISNDTVTVANPYGYLENVSIDEFLARTRFDAYENMPLFLKMGFVFTVFEKNTIFVIMSKDNPNEEVLALVNDFQNLTSCSDVSVVTYENGEVLYYGDRDSLYQIGSMTKAFTGLAIEKLVIEGKISPDDYVSDYVEDFEAYFGDQKQEITIQNLLEQKSGFTNSEKDYPSASAGMSLDEWAKSISGKDLKYQPGTTYAYSNVNYNLLGLIIERVTGISFKDSMENEILTPLGLSHTFVGEPDAGRVTEGSRIGYKHAFDYAVPVREASIPAGYFYSNTEDMARWMSIWMGEEEVPEVYSKAIEVSKKRLSNEGDYYSGWEYFPNDTIGHSGGTPNYSSRMVFSDDAKIGVCVLTNLNVAASTDSLCNAIFDTLKGQNNKKIRYDVWTVFDCIFTLISVIGIFVMAFVLTTKKRASLLVSDIVLSILFILILILFPIIFSAGLKDILLTWAPISMTGGIIILGINILFINVKLLTVKKHASNYKAG